MDSREPSAADVPGEALGGRADPPPDASVEGVARFGHYRILRQIAAGGMGIVYEAQQESPRRTVALKVIHPGLASPAVLRRFEVEGQILGRLHHPGIAQIHEAGTGASPTGPRPFFAMELVDGRPLVEYAEENDLGTSARLELVAKVCDAVQHAHEKGVIHRDLKPANVLVEPGGQPKVLDFGVARVTDSDLRTATMQTDVGQLLGTVPYMSPEQVAADPNELDTRSDVYSLGVILYELVSGRPPYDLSKKMLHEAARIIREVDPVPLSSVSRVFRGDVETIVQKALEKDKARRYASAAELAEDIRRYLADEPIVARPASAMYQLGKFARRNKILVGGMAAVFVVLVAGVVVSRAEAARARHAEGLATERLVAMRAARDLAEDRRREADTARLAAETAEKAEAASAERARAENVRARAVIDFLHDMLASADPNRSGVREVTVREILDDAASRLDAGTLADQPEVEAAVRSTLGVAYLALARMEEAERHLRRALALRVEQDDPSLVAEAEHDLGKLLVRTEQLEEAEDHLQAALAVHRRLAGERSREVADDLAILAMLRNKLDRNEESLALKQQVLTIRRELFGEQDETVAAALHDLGFQYMILRDYPNAERTLREAVAVFEETAPKSVELATALRTLGGVLVSEGEFDEAERVLRRGLVTAQDLYGDLHTTTARTEAELGRVLYRGGDLAGAEPLLRDALAVQRELLGSHTEVALTMTSLASVLIAKGELEEARSALQDTLDMRVELLGENSSAVADAHLRLGRVLVASGQDGEAEPHYRLAAEQFERALGADHPDWTYAAEELALLLQRRGDLDEAEALLRRLMATRTAAWDPLQYQVMRGWHLLAEVLSDRRDWDALEALTDELLATYEEKLPPDHLYLKGTRLYLGTVLAARGRFKEAEELMLPGASAFREHPGIPAEDKRLFLSHMVRLYEGWQRPEQAAEWKRSVEELSEDR